MEDPQKVKNRIFYEPAILLLDIHPKEIKSVCGRDVCPPMFPAALFPIAKTWKHPECPLADEWITKL